MIAPLLAPALLMAAQPAPANRFCPVAGIQQLRIYEIFDHNKAAFHERFRDHAQRIMRRHGFTIVAMWETKQNGRTEFVYLLQWPDEAIMAERWKAFLADAEWTEIKRQTAAKSGQLVGTIEDRVLRRTASTC
jgi:heme-degrading monooxygenase HmoA